MAHVHGARRVWHLQLVEGNLTTPRKRHVGVRCFLVGTGKQSIVEHSILRNLGWIRAEHHEQRRVDSIQRWHEPGLAGEHVRHACVGVFLHKQRILGAVCNVTGLVRSDVEPDVGPDMGSDYVTESLKNSELKTSPELKMIEIFFHVPPLSCPPTHALFHSRDLVMYAILERDQPDSSVLGRVWWAGPMSPASTVMGLSKLAQALACEENHGRVIVEVECVGGGDGDPHMIVLGLASAEVNPTLSIVQGRLFGTLRVHKQAWTFLQGRYHSFDDKPAVVNDLVGVQRWFSHGVLSRTGDLPAVVHANGKVEWWVQGRRHRDGELPAVMDPASKRLEWYHNGFLHRDGDEPSVVCSGPLGEKYWYCAGNLHRNDDKPAFVDTQNTMWYRHGERHRDGDKPAVVFLDGSREEWWLNGKLHREDDKPAIVIAGGDRKEWYWHGKRHRDGDAPAFVCVRKTRKSSGSAPIRSWLCKFGGSTARNTGRMP